MKQMRSVVDEISGLSPQAAWADAASRLPTGESRGQQAQDSEPVCPRCGNTDRAKMEIRNGVAEYCVACHSCMRPCCNRSLRPHPVVDDKTEKEGT